MNYKTYVFSGFALAVFITALVSCRKDSVGPAGPAGASGAYSLPYKQGSVTATASGLKSDDTPFSNAYVLQYYTDIQENAVFLNSATSENDFTVVRYDSIGESFIALNFSVDEEGLFSGNEVTIRLIQKQSNGSFFYFGTGNAGSTSPESESLGSYYTYGTSAITFNNEKVNTSTGAVSFDYTIELWAGHNSSGSKATITGSINTVINKGNLRKAAE